MQVFGLTVCRYSRAAILGEPKALSKQCLISDSSQIADASYNLRLSWTLMHLVELHQGILPASSNLWLRGVPVKATSLCLIKLSLC